MPGILGRIGSQRHGHLDPKEDSSFRSQYYKRTEVEYRGVVQNQWCLHWKEAVTPAFSRLDLSMLGGLLFYQLHLSAWNSRISTVKEHRMISRSAQEWRITTNRHSLSNSDSTDLTPNLESLAFYGVAKLLGSIKTSY